MHDERWRDTYDAWKLRSPDDERDRFCDDEPDEWSDCWHEDYESDILTGRATCNMCGHAWWQSKEEIEAEIRHIAEYDEWRRRQERRERWEWLLRPLERIMAWRPFTSHKRTEMVDDDIPF